MESRCGEIFEGNGTVADFQNEFAFALVVGAREVEIVQSQRVLVVEAENNILAFARMINKFVGSRQNGGGFSYFLTKLPSLIL